MSASLLSHGLQHTRLPCPSPTPGACSDSCPSSRWCHPTISSSVVPFSCLQSFPESGSFPVNQFFTSGGQSIGVSASASVLFQWTFRTDFLEAALRHLKYSPVVPWWLQCVPVNSKHVRLFFTVYFNKCYRAPVCQITYSLCNRRLDMGLPGWVGQMVRSQSQIIVSWT